ncbi:ComF family protein [Helicovermis profundi]|uniref:ComF family protein n=1 Tax=Helicovermis profundi TaxID=3065157 RepID=A0AAU9EYQ2_9FIRM|nr:ComF family protein [Clostridia bacterium S502]
MINLKIFSKILDLIFPDKVTCVNCGCEIYSSDKYSLCEECLKTLTIIKGKTCRICGRGISEISSYEKCMECRKNDFYFDGGFSLCVFSGTIKKLLMDFKYNEKNYLYSVFSDLIIDNLNLNDLDIDLITFVPVHFTRKFFRGYNQSELIANDISKKIGINSKKILIRTKITKRLKVLSKEERKNEIEGAFIINNKKNFTRKNILIIDDIYTTGTTLNECSKVLKYNGAEKIYICTLAIRCKD